MTEYVYLFICLSFLFGPSLGDCQSRAIWDPDLKLCLMPIARTENYTLAEGECESYRGMLISVHNAFENGVVQQEANMFFIYYYYLGAQRRSNTWKWIDGTPFTYQNWAQNEPAATGNCLLVDVFNGLWSAANCSESHQAFCATPSV